jgi:hypothetical protein
MRIRIRFRIQLKNFDADLGCESGFVLFDLDADPYAVQVTKMMRSGSTTLAIGNGESFVVPERQ